jgi:hypothetical protein
LPPAERSIGMRLPKARFAQHVGEDRPGAVEGALQAIQKPVQPGRDVAGEGRGGGTPQATPMGSPDWLITCASSTSRCAPCTRLRGRQPARCSPHHAGEKVGALLRLLIPTVFRPHFSREGWGGGTPQATPMGSPDSRTRGGVPNDIIRDRSKKDRFTCFAAPPWHFPVCNYVFLRDVNIEQKTCSARLKVRNSILLRSINRAVYGGWMLFRLC